MNAQIFVDLFNPATLTAPEGVEERHFTSSSFCLNLLPPPDRESYGLIGLEDADLNFRDLFANELLLTITELSEYAQREVPLTLTDVESIKMILNRLKVFLENTVTDFCTTQQLGLRDDIKKQVSNTSNSINTIYDHCIEFDNKLAVKTVQDFSALRAFCLMVPFIKEAWMNQQGTSYNGIPFYLFEDGFEATLKNEFLCEISKISDEAQKAAPLTVEDVDNIKRTSDRAIQLLENAVRDHYSKDLLELDGDIKLFLLPIYTALKTIRGHCIEFRNSEAKQTVQDFTLLRNFCRQIKDSVHFLLEE